MAKMDDTTKLLHKDFQVLILQNKETNAHLKKLNKPSTLPQSTNENLGEILAGVAVGAMDRKAEDAIAKGHNLGLGVTSKNGIDIVPGSEPKSPNAKETLFGITRAFYAKHSVQTLVDSLGKVNETLIKQEKKENEVIHLGHENKTTMDKLVGFLRSDSGDGFFGSLADKLGITKFRKFAAKLFSAKERKNLYKGFGRSVGLKIKGIGSFIFTGLKNLGTTLLKPLGSIVKGIIGLPKKILGFFGGVLNIIGRLALLGGGIFALSKLTEFLRNVGPGGRQNITEFLMSAFDTASAVLVALKDIIEQVVIPALGALANAIYGVVKFLAEKGLIPGVDIGQGGEAKRRKIIAKEVRESDRFSSMSDEEFAKDKLANDIIEGRLIAATEKAYKDALFFQEYVKRRDPIVRISDAIYRLGEFVFQGKNPFRSKEEEREDAFRKRFFINSAPDGSVIIFGKELISPTEHIKQILKNIKEDNQSSINAGVSVAQVDSSTHFVNDRLAMSIGGNPINYSVYS